MSDFAYFGHLTTCERGHRIQWTKERGVHCPTCDEDRAARQQASYKRVLHAPECKIVEGAWLCHTKCSHYPTLPSTGGAT